MRTSLAGLMALAVLAATAGCGDDPEPDGSSVASDPPPTNDVTPPPEPSTPTEPDGPGEPPFPTDTTPDDGGYGEGGPRWVTAVRTARHDGFDRVVIDLGGTGTPGWYVSYIDDPRQDGSGDPVAVEGDTYLQVVLRGMGYPGLDGVPETEVGTTSGAGTGSVTEVVPAGVFEGDLLAFVGLTGSPRPFRVFALTDPTRVVVDVRDE